MPFKSAGFVTGFTTNDKRTYCVIVNDKLPFARSVSFGGYEPNEVMSAGTR